MKKDFWYLVAQAKSKIKVCRSIGATINTSMQVYLMAISQTLPKLDKTKARIDFTEALHHGLIFLFVHFSLAQYIQWMYFYNQR